MIIPLILFNKYFKSIIISYTRTKRIELLSIDLKSIILPLNYVLLSLSYSYSLSLSFFPSSSLSFFHLSTYSLLHYLYLSSLLVLSLIFFIIFFIFLLPLSFNYNYNPYLIISSPHFIIIIL